jgi:hypothetical protein
LSELVEGISQKMLTQTLRHMEHDGLITNYDDYRTFAKMKIIAPVRPTMVSIDVKSMG